MRSNSRVSLLTGLSLLSILTSGCGGAGGSGVRYDLTPSRATVAPRGDVALLATYLETSVTGFQFAVRPNGNGGTILGNQSDGSATYTAPSSTGIDTVEVKFLSGGEVVATRTATITTRRSN